MGGSQKTGQGSDRSRSPDIRDGFTKISPYAAEQFEFRKRFIELLKTQGGFEEVDRATLKRIQTAAGIKGEIYADNEVILNRALGSDKRKSNFFVFIRKTMDKVEVYYSDPTIKTMEELKHEKHDKNPTGEEYLVRRIFIMGDEEAQAKRFANEVLEYAKKKPDNEYRKISHAHWGKLDDRWIVDDGVSRAEDVIRTMMLYHIDYDATTPHNSFEEDVFDYLSKAENVLGIKKVPGVELTIPWGDYGEGPNGPHFVLWMADKETARTINRDILCIRKNDNMISYFSGMKMGEMFRIIQRLRIAKKLALGVAHPVNFNSPTLPIFDVGLLSSVQNSWLSPERVEGITKLLADSVAACNPSPDNIVIYSEKFAKYALDMIRKNIGDMTGIITPNNVNLAFALEMKKKYSIYTHFDPDDHSVLPMNYECGGEKTSQGFTKVVVPETIYATLSDKPSPEQLVRMIRERTIEMDSVQNIVNENDDGEPGYITIAPSRRGVHPSKVKLAEQMEKAKMRRYIGALAHDFWNRLIQGELDNILSMAG